MTNTPKNLSGRVAVVSGGTRGAGRGIAVELGAAGATVYVTGRTTSVERSPMARRETIEETARLVDQAGGTGIPVRVDHADTYQVRALIERITDGRGRLDILVNDIWGGDPLTEWDTPFWQHDLANGIALLRNAVETHLITSWYAAPLLAHTPGSMIVEITDGVSDRYRGSLFYDLAKSAVIRLAVAQAEDLRPHGVTVVALTPGFLRSEAMLEGFGVDEGNWRVGIEKDQHFAYSETPRYIGRHVARPATSAAPSPPSPQTRTNASAPAPPPPPGSSPRPTSSSTSTGRSPTGGSGHETWGFRHDHGRHLQPRRRRQRRQRRRAATQPASEGGIHDHHRIDDHHLGGARWRRVHAHRHTGSGNRDRCAGGRRPHVARPRPAVRRRRSRHGGGDDPHRTRGRLRSRGNASAARQATPRAPGPPRRRCALADRARDRAVHRTARWTRPQQPADRARPCLPPRIGRARCAAPHQLPAQPTASTSMTTHHHDTARTDRVRTAKGECDDH